MSDKPVAFLVTAFVVAPVCAVCILGPAVIGGFFAGWFGWLADLSVIQAMALGILAAILVFGISRYRRTRKADSAAARPGGNR